jgi:transposase
VQACPVLAQKKRDEQDFAMKAITLSKLQKAARDGQCRLIYFDEAGFSASPSVQRGWSPRGKPHCVTPNPHCRRSVMGALDFGANTLIHEATKQSVKRPAVVQFLDRVAQQADQRPTVVVLDNASIHHDIDHETLDRWLIEHRMMLFYLPPYSPELNMIEILWKQAKYHWRRFVTWTRDTIDSEIDALLGAYGSTYQIRFH